jgi:hypothetical protein
MHIRVFSVEEHTSHIQRIIDGVNETLRPVTSVTIAFKLESGGPDVKRRFIDSRRLSAYMNDGHTYRMQYQLDGFMWITVTYRIDHSTANPFGATTTERLRARAFTNIKSKLEAALASR